MCCLLNYMNEIFENYSKYEGLRKGRNFILFWKLKIMSTENEKKLPSEDHFFCSKTLRQWLREPRNFQSRHQHSGRHIIGTRRSLGLPTSLYWQKLMSSTVQLPAPQCFRFGLQGNETTYI